MSSTASVAYRRIARSPSLSIAIVCLLGLAIGAFGAVFTVAYGLLKRPLPYPDQERLVALTMRSEQMGMTLGWPQPYVDRVRDGARSIELIAAYDVKDFSLTDASGRFIGTKSVTVLDPAALPMLGFSLLHGRAFDQNDADVGSESVVIVGARFAKSLFGGQQVAIGNRIMLGGEPFRIVGVLKDGDGFPNVDAQVFLPRKVSAEDRSLAQAGSFGSLRLIALVRDGSSTGEASADIGTTIRQEPTLKAVADQIGLVETAQPLRSVWVEGREGVITTTLLSTLLLLVIGISAVYNLFLIRMLKRRHQFALQQALGASLARRLSELAIEAGALAVLGGLLGAALMFVGLEVLGELDVVPVGMPVTFGLDLATAACIVVVLLATTVAMVSSGLILQGKGALTSLREGAGQSPGKWVGAVRDGLTLVQVSLSAFLLIITAILMGSANALLTQDLGIEPEGMVTGRVEAPLAPSESEIGAQRAAIGAWIREVGELPGIDSAALSSAMPFGDSLLLAQVKTLESDGPMGDSKVFAYVSFGSETYLRSMGIKLLRGRFFTADEAASGALVAIIGESFEKEHLDGNALGRSITVLDGESAGGVEAVVVGVVADVRQRALEDPDGYSVVYRPSSVPYRVHGLPENAVAFSLRTEPGLTITQPELQKLLAKYTSQFVIDDVVSAHDLIRRQIQDQIQLNRLLRILALATLVLTGIGIYCVVSFNVAYRTREFGVRKAIGATSGTIAYLVIARAMKMSLVGSLAGVVAAYCVTFVLGPQVFGAGAFSVLPYLAVTLLVVLVAVAACLYPTLQAIRLEPLQALRAN